MPFSSFSSAGVVAIQAGVVDIDGIPWGLTGVPITLTPTPLSTMKFSKRLGGMLPSPVWATAIGDNHRNIHQYAFNAAEMMQLAFQFHAQDLDAYVGFLKLKKFTQANGYAALMQSNAPVNAAQAVVVVNADAQIADPGGTFGLKRFINEIYSLVTIVPKLANLQEVTPADWEYEGRPTQAGKLPWQTPFSLSTHGAVRAGGIIVGSDYPIVVESMLDTAGGATTMVLTYTPATPGATYVELFKLTAAGAYSTLAFALATKTLTFAALAAGDRIIAKYEATDYIQSI